jgi:hypothetical protein
MSTKTQRTYPSCGNELSGAMEFCPVCLLTFVMFFVAHDIEKEPKTDNVWPAKHAAALLRPRR